MPKQEPKTGRKLVSVPKDTFTRVEKLQTDLQAISGKNVTLGDVIERGVLCLEDAHGRQAWLSPIEQNRTTENARSGGRYRQSSGLAYAGTRTWDRPDSL